LRVEQELLAAANAAKVKSKAAKGKSKAAKVKSKAAKVKSKADGAGAGTPAGSVGAPPVTDEAVIATLSSLCKSSGVNLDEAEAEFQKTLKNLEAAQLAHSTSATRLQKAKAEFDRISATLSAFRGDSAGAGTSNTPITFAAAAAAAVAAGAPAPVPKRQPRAGAGAGSGYNQVLPKNVSSYTYINEDTADETKGKIRVLRRKLPGNVTNAVVIEFTRDGYEGVVICVVQLVNGFLTVTHLWQKDDWVLFKALNPGSKGLVYFTNYLLDDLNKRHPFKHWFKHLFNTALL
jgi:hypothetical protein